MKCTAGFNCSQQSFGKYKVLGKPTCLLKKPAECDWQEEEKEEVVLWRKEAKA